jgi:hypothetical protein
MCVKAFVADVAYDCVAQTHNHVAGSLLFLPGRYSITAHLVLCRRMAQRRGWRRSTSSCRWRHCAAKGSSGTWLTRRSAAPHAR